MMALDPHPTYVQPEILEVLPEPLLSSKSWLLWRALPHPKKPGKLRKIPVYLSGKQRQGLLDTEADLAELCTLDEALAEYRKGHMAGLGFALTGLGVSAFDLDDCLGKDGALLLSHPGAEIAIRAEILGCYMEISPSGRGLRIVGPSSNFPAFSSGGLEWWSERRFVVLTGDLYANPRGWVPLDELREPLGNLEKTAVEAGDGEDGVIMTPRVIDELRSALQAIPSDERELWIRLGMALKTIGPKGRELWLEWSRKSQVFDEEDAFRVWETLRPRNTNYKVVFAEAIREHGWTNPNRKSKAEMRDEEEDDLPPDKAFEVGLGDNRLRPTEFVLDGFLPVGVSVIAGAWGAGKSVNLIPLACSIAHLAPEHWGFRPALRRKVLWVTEAPEQAIDTIYSMAKTEGSAPWEEISEWFRLFRAHRRDPKRLAKMLAGLIDDSSYTLDNGFRVNPVVILDTTSANIEIENESDNSLVSQAIAVLKQSLPGVSLILVGHTPKALVKANVSDMTFRGAGAWEADAVATYFLIHDPEIDARYLALRKCRFSPDYKEIEFSSDGGTQIIDTPWGDPQSKSYLHGVPVKSSGERRKTAQAEARENQKEEVREKTLSDRQRRVLEFVEEETQAGRPPTKASIRRAVSGKADLVVEAINRLLESGRLTARPWVDSLGDYRGPEPLPLILLPEQDLGAFVALVAEMGTT